jgi:hypothetical protein
MEDLEMILEQRIEELKDAIILETRSFVYSGLCSDAELSILHEKLDVELKMLAFLEKQRGE